MMHRVPTLYHVYARHRLHPLTGLTAAFSYATHARAHAAALAVAPRSLTASL